MKLASPEPLVSPTSVSAKFAAPRPLIVMWNYGHWCNMNCLHCYSRPKALAAKRDMTTPEAEAIAQQIIDAKVMLVHFGGAEPLSRKDFIPTAKKLTEAGVQVVLSTNGSFLNENLADKLAELPVQTIAFSIHGSDSESHDSFNQFKGASNLIVPAIERMVLRKIRTKLVMTITKPVAPHAAEILHKAHLWGVDMVQFQTTKQTGNAVINSSKLTMTKEEWLATYNEIWDAQKKLEAAGSPLKIDLGLDNDPMLAQQLGLPTVLKQCECGVYSVTITADGDVNPCGLIPVSIGNVHEKPLKDIWANNNALNAIQNGTASPCDKY